MVVLVVVVVSAITGPRSFDGALDDTFLVVVGGSTEGPRETLRLRVVVVSSGEASAALCDRVAGIVVIVVGTSWACGGVANR